MSEAGLRCLATDRDESVAPIRGHPRRRTTTQTIGWC